mmetsp:Transcript_6352/g.14579  ORF Transcript_6352/g.14579 Transcript_6352/m.14579 type:complete len:404 (+) Transcript_6352:68-1279(+)
MLNVAAAFGGGLLIRQTLDEIKLPKFKRTTEEAASFRLSVRVAAASVPALVKPGWMSSQRPRLEVTIGESQKETELGDYEEGNSHAFGLGASKDCPWRFGDTLTFKLHLQDLVGPGLKLKLRAVSDITLGPLQLQMSRIQEVAEASIDLRRRALPGCLPKISADGSKVWGSPLLLVPLSHVKGGVLADAQLLGDAAATVAISFTVDTDPEVMLEAVDAMTRTVSETLAMKAGGLMRQVYDAPLGWFADDGEKDDAQEVSGPGSTTGLRTLTPGEAQAAADRAKRRSGKVPKASEQPLLAPELEPEGWISRKGPNGRYHWHHRSLGPAPWEEDPASFCEEPSGGRPSRSISFGPMLGTGLPQESWTSHKGPDGRIFWHNTFLGPAPWEEDSRGSLPTLREESDL